LNFDDFGLDSRLMQGVRAAGYDTPTPIQLAAIPPALAGHDLIGTAQTGTGKTAAFVLPILQRLLKSPRGRVRALIVTPTRELAEQINDTIRALGQASGLRSATIYGGVSMLPQERALREGVAYLALDGVNARALLAACWRLDTENPAVATFLKLIPEAQLGAPTVDVASAQSTDRSASRTP